MKRAEIVFTIFVIIGLSLKFIPFPGGGFFVMLGLFPLVVMYFLFSFAYFNNIQLRDIFRKRSYDGISALRMMGTIGLGFGLSNTLLGSLFKIQSYPNHASLFWSGLIPLTCVAIISIIQHRKNKSPFYNKIFSRIIIIGTFGLVFAIIPKTTLFATFHRDFPDYVQAVKNLEADPENELLQMEVEIQREIMRTSDSVAYVESEKLKEEEAAADSSDYKNY